ncbi:hypothetical protein HDV01_002171 [Terramyces sp. JEL0728]|nr:hypothetical protein HDV01_002171 [Terramyces sp. JEL0728]
MLKKQYGYRPSKLEYPNSSKIQIAEKKSKNNLLSALELKLAERSSKPYLEIPTAIFQQITELNKTEYQTTEKLSPSEARAETATAYHSFSEAYASLFLMQCFLLLSNSRLTKTQVKERANFECVYTITIDFILYLLNSYGLSFLIIHELERVFRSDMFKPSNDILFKDPLHLVSFKFFKSLDEPEPSYTEILPKGWDGFMPNIERRLSLTSKVGKWGGISPNKALQDSGKSKIETVPKIRQQLRKRE